MSTKTSIALFDFDGTITNKDSMFDFIRFAVGHARFVFGMLWLSPMLIAHVLKLIKAQPAKEMMLSHFFKGWSAERFSQTATEYAQNKIDVMVFAKALEKIHWHQRQDHQVVVVTASVIDWVKPWCDKNNIEILGSQLEIQDGKVTGRLAGNNCQGQEKVNRIEANYPLNQFETIYAYGNSSGDKQMLAIANETGYRAFEG